MQTQSEIARAFSSGNFKSTEAFLRDDISWHMYEDNKHLSGKAEVLAFCKQIAEYFAAVTTDFKESGLIEDKHSIAIYGHARFIREGVTVNEVDSTDIYEFDENGKIAVIRSYCNSNRPTA